MKTDNAVSVEEDLRDAHRRCLVTAVYRRTYLPSTRIGTFRLQPLKLQAKSRVRPH